MFMGPQNWYQGMNSVSLCSLAGRYENPIPPWCLAPIDFLKIPAQITFFFVPWKLIDCCVGKWKVKCLLFLFCFIILILFQIFCLIPCHFKFSRGLQRDVVHRFVVFLLLLLSIMFLLCLMFLLTLCFRCSEVPAVFIFYIHLAAEYKLQIL